MKTSYGITPPPEALAAIIVGDAYRKNPLITADELYTECLKEGVELRFLGHPLGRDLRKTWGPGPEPHPWGHDPGDEDPRAWEDP